MGSAATPGTPGTLGRLWQGWKRFGRKLADVQARLLLTIVYFTVILPFGIAVRLFADPLGIKPGHRHGWLDRAPDPGTPLARAGQQF